MQISVSERGLQSQLVNNYDRISKAALENKWNVESTFLLVGLGEHRQGGNCPASATWSSEPQKPRYKQIFGHFAPELELLELWLVSGLHCTFARPQSPPI